MTPDLLRRLIRFGVASLIVITPLPFGSVQSGWVLAIELVAAALGLLAILLIGRDETARASVPRGALLICAGVIALGIFQIIPWPFSIAEKFNPTAELMRPLIPYLGLDHPPAVTWSVAAPETTDALLRFVAYVLIGLAAAVAYDTSRSRRRFAVVLVGAAVFQAVYGSGEYLSGHQHIFGFAKKYYLDSATGTFINRNHMATMLAMALPFALVLALPGDGGSSRRERSWRERLVATGDGGGLRRLLAVGASAVIWMGLLLSHSRAGLLAALVAAGIVLVRFRGVRAARWSAAIGAAVLLILLSAELTQAPGERFFTVKDDMQSKGGRLTVWRDSMGLVKQRPLLGWGFGTFESAFPTVQSEGIDLLYDHAHDEWVEWTTEGGALALGAAAGLLIVSLRATRNSGAGRSFDVAFSVACRAAIVAVALHAIWDFSLRMPAVAVALGAVVALAPNQTARSGSEQVGMRRMRSA
ncbi:MAG TPA: O-antigen ligase family protein [Candidatus Polarisedimenticolaceae bacterium]|nr:O-antigen ligase family protein [Candidatus Polarisedimenticolaceae bacterium]